MSDILLRLCETVSDVAVGLDDQGTICLFNPVAERVFGLRAAEVHGSAPSDHPALGPLLPLLARGGANGGTAREELILPSGHVFWAQLFTAPEVPQLVILKQTGGPTEATSELTMQIKRIVHDLKQPITAVKGFVELVREGGELNDIQIQFSQRAISRLAFMETMANELLDVMWLEFGSELECTTIDLKALVTDVLHDAKTPANAQQITIQTELPDDVCEFYGDERRLQSVFSNLVSNAIKYSPNGGPVVVRLAQSDRMITLEVADHGLGIAPEHLEHIFERFYRVRNDDTWRIEGTGLGLEIVKAIVEKHGGTIAVSSVLGEGSSFVVTLPLNSAPD